MGLIDEDLTYAIRGCCFDVQNEVGFGLPEEPYHKALAKAFRQTGIPAWSKQAITLSMYGISALELVPDFLIADRVVLELKAIREEFAREHEIQLFSYLKATEFRVGYLINFGRERIHDWRRVFDEKPIQVSEDWSEIKNRIAGKEKQVMTNLRETILDIGNQHGLGYGESIYWRLLAAGLKHHSITCDTEPTAYPKFHDEDLGEYTIHAAVAGQKIVCLVTALREGISNFDIARAKSYAQNTNLRYAIVANFGKQKLEVKAIIA